MSRQSDAALAQRLQLLHPFKEPIACPYLPTPKQGAFLWLDELEAFYGGAAGPGKSTALLMGATQYVDRPGFAALLLRRTYPELALPGGLMAISHEWFGDGQAVWRGFDHTWKFPSGATITFGHMDTEEAKRRYQSAEFQYIGFDELTHFTQTQYEYLLSRVRRPSAGPLATVPLRMRSASNPGGPGHDWVKAYFIDPATRRPDVVFLPAKIHENPHLDVDSYIRQLGLMSGADRDRLLEGDWDVQDTGGMFRVGMIEWVSQPLANPRRQMRAWDFASSEPTPSYPDPDYTCGLRGQLDWDGAITLTGCSLWRKGPGETERLFRSRVQQDGHDVTQVFEREGGASGKQMKREVQKWALGYIAQAVDPSGDKVTRAKPVAAAMENGLLRVVSSLEHKDEVLQQWRRFPQRNVHDDAVDTLSLLYQQLAQGEVTVSSAAGIQLPNATESSSMIRQVEMLR